MKYIAIVTTLIGLMCIYGWCSNVYSLIVKDDFSAPYKAEVLRLAGVPVAPLGVFLGLFVTFDEEKGK